MSFLQQTWGRVVAAYKAFREPYLVSQLDIFTGDDNFSKFEARRLRYAIFWGFYQNTAYRSNVHTWSHAYRVEHGLYRYIRNIYNPAYRLGELWKSFIWGGELDPLAGDGVDNPSALPITIPEENAKAELLRAAISQLWKWSNWRTRKDLLALQGAILGDIGLRVYDDPKHKRAYLDLVHPGSIRSVELDNYGNVKAYVLEESRADPVGKAPNVIYTEEVTRDGDNIIWRTYLNGDPYAWTVDENGNPVEEWSHPYGFVPFVLIQHNDVGLNWGWAEFHPARSKVHEVDDLASKLSDQIRKMVDAPWLLGGVNKGRSTVTATSTDSETYQESSTAIDKPHPGREEIPIFYGPVGATATPLVTPLDIAATSEHIRSILEEIERDYPELQQDIWTASGERSGRALRLARQRVEIKVRQRRPHYDGGLVKAHQMAIAVAGYHRYPGFEAFSLDSYAKGELEHSIGKRPVFQPDPLDEYEEDGLFWDNALKAGKAGVGLEAYLKLQGWDEERIKNVINDPEFQSRLAMAQLGLQMAQGGELGGAARDEMSDGEGEDGNKSAARGNRPS